MDELPKSAIELRKSEEGRKILAEYQKRHELDILQPNNPKFNQVYGEQIKHNEQERHKAIRDSNDMWMAHQDKKNYEQRKRGTVNRKYL